MRMLRSRRGTPRRRMSLNRALIHARVPRLERFDSAYRFVHAVPRKDPAERRIRKISLAGVEAESLVNHQRLVARFAALPEKNCLPPVGVTGPFVEDQQAAKARKIHDCAELLLRQKIKHHNFYRRPFLPASLDNANRIASPRCRARARAPA